MGAAYSLAICYVAMENHREKPGNFNGDFPVRYVSHYQAG